MNNTESITSPSQTGLVNLLQSNTKDVMMSIEKNTKSKFIKAIQKLKWLKI